jgi:hypothetical protein
VTSTANDGDSMMNNFRHARVRLINCTYTNIGSTSGNSGGVIFITSSSPGLDINGTVFLNVSVRNNGGVMKDEYSGIHTIVLSTFQNCSSTQGGGGAIYVNYNYLPSLINCKFLSNSAYTGGKDISHAIITFSNSYSSNSLSGTCSTSGLPRIYFANGSNVDNLLIGFINYLNLNSLFFFFFLKKKNVIHHYCT